MRTFELGHGDPLVFIPGLQGRWEYNRATIEALATRFRVITFSLCDERSAQARFDPARGFDSYGDQVAAALDAADVRRAIVCGLSFGGLVAINFAVRYPDRLRALVLVSTPGPGWRLRPRHELYARLPWIFGPVFLCEAPFRARAELAAALPSARERRAFGRTMLRTLMNAPVSVSRMAARARLIGTVDVAPLCARIQRPTLVITGEPHLDYVVPVDGSSRYGELIQGAQSAVLERTGHQGTMTRPDAFAALVDDFAKRVHDAAA